MADAGDGGQVQIGAPSDRFEHAGKVILATIGVHFGTADAALEVPTPGTLGIVRYGSRLVDLAHGARACGHLRWEIVC